METRPSLEKGDGVNFPGLTLLFVYNADTGLFNVVSDYAHKILSPATYPCNLCALTYGNMGMNKKWKSFVSGLSLPVEFMHRDEMVKQGMARNVELPAAFLREGGSVKLLISRDEINRCSSVDDLIGLVTARLQTVKS